jgi:hypothetical protein
MTLLWMRISTPIFAVLVAAMLLIQAKTYDDSGLRTFLSAPGGCDAPCFMGIRPGETTVAEATLILQEHPWVDAIDINFDIDAREGNLAWKWSGQQPPQIRPEREGSLRICDSLICSVSIPTRIPFGDFLLTFGQPDAGALRSFVDQQGTMVLHIAAYEALQFNIRSRNFCPPNLTAMALHHNFVTLQMGIVRDSVGATSNAPRYQIINFQGQAYSWLLRRAFVCA